MKLVRYWLLFVVVLVATQVHANDTVIVVKDVRMDLLTIKQAQVNKRSSMMTSSGQYKGYRIQVVSTSSRSRAQEVKTEMMNRFPDQKSYLLFQSPNFKVRVGNFLKKEDAEKFRKQLNKVYPQGGYVVEDAIEYVPKEEEFFE